MRKSEAGETLQKGGSLKNPDVTRSPSDKAQQIRKAQCGLFFSGESSEVEKFPVRSFF
jgi:hypothetical protein